MDVFRIAQVVYLVLNLIGTTILLVALVTILNWPAVRGRGLLLLCFLLKLAAGGGYLALSLFQMLQAFVSLGPGFSSGELFQVAYMLLATIGLIGDGFLVAALISLAGVLRSSGSAGGNPAASPWRVQ
jgi:hypothetical protein